MEFVPAVLFLRETAVDDQGNPKNHVEFNDCDWHFYALGNIGDSKKTDYTRAYDPDDMNEFTLEISDNNTKNSQFQSGLYKVNGVDTVEQADSGTNSMNYLWGLTDAQWNATRSPNADELAIRAQINAGAEDLVDVIMGGENADGSDGEVYVNYRHRMLVSEPFDGDHSFEFRYACKGDYRDGDLVNSVEGKEADKQQEKLNRKVFEAFYSWLVTATDAQYRDEAELWFVPGAMEFFYAFTHYYTMMDNRAKNTFWHFAHTGTRRAVPIGRAVKALMHVYEESDGNGGYQPATGEFDNTKQYYTSYAFDLWVYDCDTAAGIDNNGALVFPYGKEDSDYRTEGDALSGMAFNGAGSIFWRRLKNTFANDIRTIMTQTPVNCFNSQNLIDEFDATQECYPEEVWRLDIERKYIRTFTGVSAAQPYDNAVAEGKQNPRFLRSMMQGRKKYQRRQWIRDQGVYFNSKYRLNDILDNQNTIEFNATTPAIPEWQANSQYYINDYVRTKVEPFDELKPKFKVWRCIEANNDSTFTAAHWQASVTPEYMLTLTPYQDMYLNVQVGNGNYQASYITNDGSTSLRAKAGRPYTFDISGSYQETRIYINGANHLSGISGLAPMYPYEFDLRALKHIKVLDIGIDDATYTNTKFTTLGLETDKPLLETLNIKNCRSLGGAINLTNASNIRTVEATGTLITTVNLPQYTNIETLHLPITATDISLYAARKLTDFTITDSNGNIDYSHITKLDIRDSDYAENINWMDIATAMLENAENIYISDLQLSSINNIQVLQDFADRKTELEINGPRVTLAGVLKVLGDYSDIEKTTYEDIWSDPQLILDVSAGHLVTKYKVTYQYPDGTHIATLYINRGDQIVDIWSSGYLKEMPSMDDTVSHTYMFGERRLGSYIAYSGWLYPGDTKPLSYYTNRPPVANNLIITAYFTATTRTYNVNWFMNRRDTVPVKTAVAQYGGGYDLAAPTVMEIREGGFSTVQNYSIVGGTVSYEIFNGWEKLPTNINPGINDTSYNIYANWLTREIPLIDLFPNTMTGTELSIEQLFVLSHMDNTARAQYVPNLTTGATLTCTTGHEGPDDGTLIVGTQQMPILRTDVDFTYEKGTINLRPFQTTSGAFTLVLDYCFNVEEIEAQISSSNRNFAVLASTYYHNNAANTDGGFALFYNLNDGLGGQDAIGPRIGFGDMFNDITQSVALGTSTTAGLRNIVVLRYVPNNDTNTGVLHIYSGYKTDMTLNSSDISLPTEVSYSSISWSNISPDNKLIFGRVADDDSANNYSSIINNSTNGIGTIFWSKYWDYDLGEGECIELASWPHERMTFAVTKLNNAPSSGNSSAIFLTAMEASAHGLVYQTPSTASPQGWGRSLDDGGVIAREICQNRIFPGLPTILQSIITKQKVDYRTVSSTQGLYGMSYTYDTNTSSSYDYIYLLSSANLADANSATYDALKREDADNIYMYPWVNSESIVVYSGYNNANRRWSVDNSSEKMRYFNFRFPYQAVPAGNVRVFKAEATNAQLGSHTVVEAINNNNSGIDRIRTGDIFLDITSTPQAYVFVDTATIVQYGIQYQPYDGIFNVPDDSGAWVPGIKYNTRSMVTGGSTSLQVVNPGTGLAVMTSVTKDGTNLVYSFSI